MLDIRFWAVVMTCWVVFSPGEVQAQPAMDQRIRKVSAYYAAYYSKVYRVPVELVEAIIEVESRWHPEALSPKGAAGLMQLMPLTAQRFGVRNRFNIEQNVRAGILYLAWLNQIFKSDFRLVSAAYLVGEKRVIERRLAYSSPAVFAYVSQVASLYRRQRQINPDNSH